MGFKMFWENRNGGDQTAAYGTLELKKGVLFWIWLVVDGGLPGTLNLRCSREGEREIKFRNGISRGVATARALWPCGLG